MPSRRDIFKTLAFHLSVCLGPLLLLDGINPFGQESFGFQAPATGIYEGNDEVVTERGKPFADVRFDVPEAPAFAAIGL